MEITNMKPMSRKTYCESINPQIMSHDGPMKGMDEESSLKNVRYSPLCI